MNGYLRKMAGCLGLLLVAAGVQAQDGPQCEDPSSSLLWKAEGEGGDVHLFGSIHVGKAEFYPLHADIEAAFRAAEYVVFEVDPAALLDPALLLEIRNRGMLPAGQTLADVVSPAVVEDLRRVLAGMGLPPEGFMGMQPWFLTLMLTALQMTQQGYSPQLGLENHFMGLKPPAMEVLELESAREQIGYLEGLNAESFLAYTLENFGQGGEEIEALMAAWQCADKAALEALLFDDFGGETGAAEGMAELKLMLFDERNQRMATGIREFIESGDGDYFVVIGAGHLLGEGSVVDLLREAGVEVEAVTLP